MFAQVILATSQDFESTVVYAALMRKFGLHFIVFPDNHAKLAAECVAMINAMKTDR